MNSVCGMTKTVTHASRSHTRKNTPNTHIQCYMLIECECVKCSSACVSATMSANRRQDRQMCRAAFLNRTTDRAHEYDISVVVLVVAAGFCCFAWVARRYYRNPNRGGFTAAAAGFLCAPQREAVINTEKFSHEFINDWHVMVNTTYTFTMYVRFVYICVRQILHAGACRVNRTRFSDSLYEMKITN